MNEPSSNYSGFSDMDRLFSSKGHFRKALRIIFFITIVSGLLIAIFDKPIIKESIINPPLLDHVYLTHDAINGFHINIGALSQSIFVISASLMALIFLIQAYLLEKFDVNYRDYKRSHRARTKFDFIKQVIDGNYFTSSVGASRSFNDVIMDINYGSDPSYPNKTKELSEEMRAGIANEYIFHYKKLRTYKKIKSKLVNDVKQLFVVLMVMLLYSIIGYNVHLEHGFLILIIPFIIMIVYITTWFMFFSKFMKEP